MATTATGVDIGLRTAKALRGYYKGNTFHVTDFALVEHRGGDPREAWAGLRGFKPGNARVGLTGRDVNIRYTRVPRVPDWQLRKLMRFEVDEIGDQSGAEVASDFNLLPELPEIEGEDVVLLAMARTSLLESHTAGLALAGGKLNSFAPSAVALYNAFLRYGVVQEDTVLVADIGHDNLDVVIARGPDLLFARNLTGGGRLFDEALAQRFNVKPDQAEKLKIEFASVRPGAQYPTPNHERASRAVLGAAGQLLSLLQSALLFCKTQVKISGLKLDRVLLCGGGAALDGLCEYIAAGMQVQVELFDPFRVVDTSALTPEKAELLEDFKLEAVVALGLASMGSDPRAYSLEILPPAVARRREFWGGKAFLFAAAALAVAYLGFYAYTNRGRAEEIRAEVKTLRGRLNVADRTHRETKDLLEENAALADEVRELSWIAGTGEQLARGLAFLDESLPDDFWVTKMTGTWGVDRELGIEDREPRPLWLVRGEARQGVASPNQQHQQMMSRLEEAFPGARLNHSFDRDHFEIDLTSFAPAAAPEDLGADEDA
jgi:Tfp pilus assembly PilM family ATPase